MGSNHLPHEIVTIRTNRRGHQIRVETATIPGVPALHARTHKTFGRAVAGEIGRRSPTTREVRVEFPNHKIETFTLGAR